MKGNQRTLIIILCIALGLVFEVIKSLRAHNAVDNQHLTAAELGHMDIRPYSRGDDDSSTAMAVPMRKSRAGRVLEKSGLKNKAESYTFGSPAEFKEDKKADAKKKKKKKKVADKKKKKKKNRKMIAEKEAGKEKKKNSPPPAPVAGASTGPTGGALGGAQENEFPTTYEEWAQLLLINPDFAMTTKFINYFQTQMVSQGVFYRIVEEMLADNRSDMNKLGIQAAAATPSYRSFMLLSQFIERFEQGHSLRATAYSHLQGTYTDLGKLKALESVLSISDSPFAVLMAAQFAQDAAVRHLKTVPKEDNNNNDNGPGSQPRPPITPKEDEPLSDVHPKAKYFTSLFRTLKRLVTESNDRRVTEAANQAIATMMPYLEEQVVSQL